MASTDIPESPEVPQLDLSGFHHDGYLEVPGYLPVADLAQLRSWVAEVESWPADRGGWFQHDEQGAVGVVRARTENFSPYHEGLDSLVNRGALVAMAGQLLGEPAVLYKEKINYKHPGGGGFAPHQDAVAYPHIVSGVSCLLAVDDATDDNGCLEFAAAHHERLLATDQYGCIDAAVARQLEWRRYPVTAGSLLWFHSHTPHRSATNWSRRSRRAMYLTYNAAAAGDHRAAYYADRRTALADPASADSDHQRLSLIGHFQGLPPEAPTR